MTEEINELEKLSIEELKVLELKYRNIWKTINTITDYKMMKEDEQ